MHGLELLEFYNLLSPAPHNTVVDRGLTVSRIPGHPRVAHAYAPVLARGRAPVSRGHMHTPGMVGPVLGPGGARARRKSSTLLLANNATDNGAHLNLLLPRRP